MPRALIIADLEGIAGVDQISDLIYVSPSYPEAQRLMSLEVAAYCQALFDSGQFDAIRVVDSHLSGSDELNLLPELLPEKVELRLEEEAYGAEVFADVDAVACLGMHVSAMDPGFVPHAVNLHCAWYLQDHCLSESDIVIALAAEHGVPVLMVSGDDVLKRSLLRKVPYVQTKTVPEGRPVHPVSLDPETSRARLKQQARQAPVIVDPVSDAPIRLVFKSRWPADAAERAGGTRTGPYEISVSGATFRERYHRARALATVSEDTAMQGIRPHSPEMMAEDLETLLHRPSGGEAVVRPDWDAIARAKTAFLRWTAGTDSQSRTLRAMVPRMLQGFFPKVFEALALTDTMATATAALQDVPLRFPQHLSVEEAQGRMDAWSLRRKAGEDVAFDPGEVERLFDHYNAHGGQLYTWVMACTAQAIQDFGWQDRFGQTPTSSNRLLDLYIKTHEILFAADYGLRTLHPRLLGGVTEGLVLAVPWIVRQRHVDIGAEVALCLQVVGEVGLPEHRALMNMLLECQMNDGSAQDASMGSPWDEVAPHATSALLLALSGAWACGPSSD